jgi:hypothetical protein
MCWIFGRRLFAGFSTCCQRHRNIRASALSTMKLKKEIVAGLAVLASQVIGLPAPTVNSLARDIERVESVREIKDLQRTFSQLAQFGRWGEIAALFSDKGTLLWGNLSTDTNTATGPVAIETWLRTDAGNMDGIRPGSLDLLITEGPLVSLSADGLTAKGRWNSIRFRGDGAGGTRIQGGIYENEYTFKNDKDGGHWEISLLHFYPMYAGNYTDGWRNTARALPIIPYHFTYDEAGIPVQPPVGDAPVTTATAADLSYRIARLNAEDEVRNLQHMYGYYVDQRMWNDVVDLFVSDSTAKIDGLTYTGAAGVRQAMERMGPAGLTQGTLNEHPMFDTIVDVDPNGREAIARGIEVGMIGDSNTRVATWEFNVYRNKFFKDQDSGVWKIKQLDITKLIVANYSVGWGTGGMSPSKTSTVPPPFLSVAGRSSRSTQPAPADRKNTTDEDLADLQRRLTRSATYDASENLSSAYGYFADDIRCSGLGALHTKRGHKESPGSGWFHTPERIEQACLSRYGRENPNVMRGSVPFHWRPQPVIHVSRDGRSASLRAKLLQTGTSASGSSGFNGGMYHDQMVLEEGSQWKWKLWSITIDEFYWQSSNWGSGWAGVGQRRPNSTTSTSSSSRPTSTRRASSSSLTTTAISSVPATSATSATAEPTGTLLTRQSTRPDLVLTDPRMGEREIGFAGGSGRRVSWPDIQRMWFMFRNPVTGRLPQWYWPGCVPCKAIPEWALTANGYQEPPTGPTLLTVASEGSGVKVRVSAGPDEPVQGVVEVREGGRLLGKAELGAGGNVTFALPAGFAGGEHTLSVEYLGSERLYPGRTTVVLNLPPVT